MEFSAKLIKTLYVDLLGRSLFRCLPGFLAVKTLVISNPIAKVAGISRINNSKLICKCCKANDSVFHRPSHNVNSIFQFMFPRLRVIFRQCDVLSIQFTR